jgi:hypothetical protein
MPRGKGREPITFSVSSELLGLADVRAAAMGLDRYDVIRLALAKGLLVLRMEHEMMQDPDGVYTALMMKLAAGVVRDDAAVRVGRRKRAKPDV